MIDGVSVNLDDGCCEWGDDGSVRHQVPLLYPIVRVSSGFWQPGSFAVEGRRGPLSAAASLAKMGGMVHKMDERVRCRDVARLSRETHLKIDFAGHDASPTCS